MKAHIRRYDPDLPDRADLQRVCADASFLGDPIAPIFLDSLWFGDLAVAPYLILEPDHTWVAEIDGRVIGYLTGSTTWTFGAMRAQLVASRMMYELVPNYVFGKYDDHPRSKRFAEFLLLEALFQVPRSPPEAAHFHFNVDKPYRGQGIGKSLISQFEGMLRGEGIHRYYAEVLSSEATRNEAHFIRLGYDIYDKVRTTVFEPEIDDLYVLCVDKRLD